MFRREPRPLSWYRGKRITVMGLGVFGGGQGVAEFLCRQGADVTVTDLKSTDELSVSLEALRDHPIRWRLGEHREVDFLEADLVVANPAVPRGVSWLELCRKNEVPLETEMNLFFKHCAGKICAVTGSNGKTTTTSLLGAMARRKWPDIRIGGNLGRSLLPAVSEIREDEWVILELSSFQLEDLAGIQRRPEISLITNLSPNHLDRHGCYENYADAKKEILAPANAIVSGIAILPGEDSAVRHWAADTSRSVTYFGRTTGVSARAPGAWIDESSSEVVWMDEGRSRSLFRCSDLKLRGRFNLLNAAGAAAAAIRLGLDAEMIRGAIREFEPVTHRLELFLESRGVEFFDDSIATTPESTIAAIEALGPGVLLICGGSSKGCSYGAMARAIQQGCREVFLIGATGPEIASALEATRALLPVHLCKTLDVAVGAATRKAKNGDRIVLSPSCPSYDQFRNFEDRGLQFKELCSRIH